MAESSKPKPEEPSKPDSSASLPDPENPPKQPWSRTKYLERKAEREANWTPEEKAQREAEASPGLQRAAEQFARDSQSVSSAFKNATNGMVRASIEGARAARIQRKGDMEEAFANALKKPEVRVAGKSISPASADEIQKILSQERLWNWEFSYIEIGQTYSARRLDHTWEKLSERDNKEVIAAATLPFLTAVATGIYAGLSWQSFFSGVAAGAGAGVITLIATFCVVFVLHWLGAPKGLDENLRGDLEAAKNQLAEEKRKLHRLAETATHTIGELDSKIIEISGQLKEEKNQNKNWEETYALKKAELHEVTRERDLLRSQLDHKVILEIIEGPWNHWNGQQMYSRVSVTRFTDSELSSVVFADIRLRFTNQDVHKARVESLTLTIRRELPGEPAREVDLLSHLETMQGTQPIIDQIFIDPRDKSQDYDLRTGIETLLDANWNDKFDSHCFLRIKMEAVGQRTYCVDLNVDWEDALKYDSPWETGRATIRRTNSC